MSRPLALLAVLGAAATSSCAGAGEDPRVQVAVKSAVWLSEASSRALALPGPANLAVTLRLTNQQASTLSLSTTHFVVGTANGLLHRASPSTGLYPSGCPPGASVRAGASTECAVVFSLSGGTAISAVGYEFDDKATSVVRISVSACTACGGACVDLATDPDHCGTCGRQLSEGGRCEGGKPACAAGLTACGDRCVNLLTDANNCGACGQAVQGGVCAGGAPSCSVPLAWCSTGCTLLSSDPGNCGRCGAACPATYACVGGQCSCAAGQTICGASCVDTRTDSDNCGACGKVCSSTQYCASGTCTTSSGGGGGGGGGCSMNCSAVGLSCCGSSCC